MAERKYLDLSGLSKLWDLIKAKIPTLYASSKSAGGPADKAVSIPFGRVDSTSTATAFTATVDGITELRDGVCVLLYNGVVTSATGYTININGLGAKPTFNNMTTATRDTTIFNVAYTMLLVYDATRVVDGITGAWCCYRGYDANTNTIGYQLRTNSMSMPTTAKFYRYRLLFTSADNTHFVPANISTSTNATGKRDTIQTPIDPFGRIVYYGSTTAVNAEAAPGATALWDQYILNLGYSFNRTGSALVLDANTPIYLKCAPQSDGSAIIDAESPYVQALPSTEDGKIYILLGWAYDGAANIELTCAHPVYYYKDGAIRIWTNAPASTNVEPATAAPLMDGTAAVGSGDKYAREDHVHPSDTTKVDKVNGKGLSTNDYDDTAKGKVDAIPSNPQYTDTIYDDTALSTRVSAIEGCESDWNSKQDGPLVGQINNSAASDYLTPSNVFTALSNHRDVYVTFSDSTYGSLQFTTWNVASTMSIVAADVAVVYNNVSLIYTLWGVMSSNIWGHDISIIPINLSDLNNDVGYITPSEAPVTSVNNQTGAVTISVPSNASDVGAIAAPASPSNNAVLMYNATTSSWEANVLVVWSGGSY